MQLTGEGSSIDVRVLVFYPHIKLEDMGACEIGFLFKNMWS